VVLAFHSDVYTHTFLYLELSELQLYVVVTANEPHTVKWLAVTIESQHWHKVVAKGWELTLWRNIVTMLKFLAFDYIPARYVFPDVYLRALTSCWFLEYHALPDIDGYTVKVSEAICASVYMSVHMTPHMDMEGEHSGSMDYSDFKYQQIGAGAAQEANTDSDTAFSFAIAYDVLDDNGGLEQNEVAELVSFRLFADLDIEDEQADQDVGTTVECRGAFGANVNSRRDIPDSNAPGGTEAKNTEILRVINQSEADVAARPGKSQVKDEVFSFYQTRAALPFDDQTNGPGGGAAFQPFTREKHYRQESGRGPVLDSTDDIGIVGKLISSDAVIGTGVRINLELVWDVAEVSDAGRAFSVPDGM
jgi:hypothetical protein